jgi:Domain of unknown function (DUF222)
VEIEQLRADIDALAAAEIVGVSQRENLGVMWREMARLDAQFARRIAELDASVEWSVDGSRSAASWLVRNFRLASGEAHHRVRVARRMAHMPTASGAWRAGRISSRHVDALTSIRHAADADAEFAAFEQYLVNVALAGSPEEVTVVGGYQPHPETVRRLSCDAFIQRIVLDSKGVPLDMGRATRTFTPDQYRAIMIRDGGCRMPGCDIGPEGCQAHHIQYWENGGRTDLDVGIAICRGAGHHRLIHEGGWSITGDPNGEVTFHDPNGDPRGRSRPRKPPDPILTRAGRDVGRAQKRAAALRCCARV